MFRNSYCKLKKLIKGRLIPPSKTEMGGCRLSFDQDERLYFVSDELFHQRVYLSDERRFKLYSGGIRHRLDWLLSDYSIKDGLIRPNDLVIDTGANIGELGIFCSMHNSEYIGIEPDPIAYKALKLNNGNSLLLNYALSSQEGEQTFYLATGTADSSLYKPDQYTETITVKVKTLDQCIQEHASNRHIRLLKVEAEGFEPEILLGSVSLLPRVEYIAIDAGPERGGVSTAPQCLNMLIKSGFDIIDTYLRRGTFLLRNSKANGQ
jgi:FkbM family methyltransferase